MIALVFEYLLNYFELFKKIFCFKKYLVTMEIVASESQTDSHQTSLKKEFKYETLPYFNL